MLNGIWAAMIGIGIGWAAIHGTMAQVGAGILDAAKEAVELCIAMAGVMGLWSGLMEIAREAGILEWIARLMRPLLRWLFPRIPKGHPALEAIATNFTANILGLGWAATPAGLEAMEQLAILHRRSEKNTHTGVASDEMCTFLVLNISSLQLIPVNVIAYRSQYGSVNPAMILVPALIATFASTLAAVIYCKVRAGRRPVR